MRHSNNVPRYTDADVIAARTADTLARQRPPYGKLQRVLWVSESVILASWHALQRTAAEGCEGVVCWAVPADQYQSNPQTCTTVVAPLQVVSPGEYEIPADGVRAMGRALRAAGLVNVAQLHTHPDEWVGHSTWDDTHAFSLRDGALSIVWPQYGHTLPPRPAWGVHECQGHVWRELTGDEAAARIRVVPAVLDLRAAHPDDERRAAAPNTESGPPPALRRNTRDKGRHVPPCEGRD